MGIKLFASVSVTAGVRHAIDDRDACTRYEGGVGIKNNNQWKQGEERSLVSGDARDQACALRSARIARREQRRSRPGVHEP